MILKGSSSRARSRIAIAAILALLLVCSYLNYDRRRKWTSSTPAVTKLEKGASLGAEYGYGDEEGKEGVMGTAAHETEPYTGTFEAGPMSSTSNDAASSAYGTKPTSFPVSSGEEEKEEEDAAQDQQEHQHVHGILQHEHQHEHEVEDPDRAGPSPDRIDGIIVMGKLAREDTSWVAEKLPEWQRAIYTVDDRNATLSTPMNRGHEAMAYLTYIIDNYHDRLPATIVFLHPHEGGYPGGWHTDAPHHSNVISIQRLRRDHVQRQGYVNLRCLYVPGCPNEIQPFRDPPDLSADKGTERAMPQRWPEIFNNTDVPSVIAVPCCAQFAVSRSQILARPHSDYIAFRQWVMDSDADDAGRIFEYLWHIIFGQDPVL